jgi:hypothetical protein
MALALPDWILLVVKRLATDEKQSIRQSKTRRHRSMHDDSDLLLRQATAFHSSEGVERSAPVKSGRSGELTRELAARSPLAMTSAIASPRPVHYLAKEARLRESEPRYR